MHELNWQGQEELKAQIKNTVVFISQLFSIYITYHKMLAHSDATAVKPLPGQLPLFTSWSHDQLGSGPLIYKGKYCSSYDTFCAVAARSLYILTPKPLPG